VGWASACGRRGPAGLAGPKAEWAGKGSQAESEEEIKILIFEFTKALEICTRRFRRDFDMRIFPKFF
jgi:hypothetical protein